MVIQWPCRSVLGCRSRGSCGLVAVVLIPRWRPLPSSLHGSSLPGTTTISQADDHSVGQATEKTALRRVKHVAPLARQLP